MQQVFQRESDWKRHKWTAEYVYSPNWFRELGAYGSGVRVLSEMFPQVGEDYQSSTILNPTTVYLPDCGVALLL